MLFLPSPTENTLATHTNFTNKEIGPRRKEGFSPKFKLVLSSIFTIISAGHALSCIFLSYFRGCGISEQVEQGTEGGPLGTRVPAALLCPETTGNLNLKGLPLCFESPAPKKHTHIQNHRLKLVLIWFSLPPLISLAKLSIDTCHHYEHVAVGEKNVSMPLTKERHSVQSTVGETELFYTAFVSHWENEFHC